MAMEIQHSRQLKLPQTLDINQIPPKLFPQIFQVQVSEYRTEMSQDVPGTLKHYI